MYTADVFHAEKCTTCSSSDDVS